MERAVAGLALLLAAAAAGVLPDKEAGVVVTPVTKPVVHGEGCYWDARKQLLYFVDISGQLVNSYDPATGKVSSIHFEGGGVSMVVPTANGVDEMVVTRGHDVLLVRWDGVSAEPESVQMLDSVEADKPGNRWNDGKADASGRLWLGTMGPEPVPGNVTPDQGALYSMETTSKKAVRRVGPVSVSNGLIWNRDNSLMYYIDSPTEHVDVFDYALGTGTLSNRRTIFDLTAFNISGVPDGMTIDSDDNLWVAVFSGGKVLKVSPSGELLRTVDIPASRVTDVVWGGPGYDVLYVTTSKLGLTEEEQAAQPLAGSVFAVTGLDATGVPGNAAVRNAAPAPAPARPRPRIHGMGYDFMRYAINRFMPASRVKSKHD